METKRDLMTTVLNLQHVRAGGYEGASSTMVLYAWIKPSTK
jgi:hypothetical protein